MNAAPTSLNASVRLAAADTISSAAETAGSSSGYISGMNSSASTKSLPVVFTDIVASNVPTPAIPIEPRTSATSSCHMVVAIDTEAGCSPERNKK
jgi:hypothetical protein